MSLGNLNIWITVPTRWLRGSDRNDFLNEYRCDINALTEELEREGFDSISINWFDPITENWDDQKHRDLIDKADVLLYYHWKGDAWFGKGASDIYDQYNKPQFIMYRTSYSDELKLYIPHSKDEKRHWDNWHKFRKMEFGLGYYPFNLGDMLSEEEDVKETPELAPVEAGSKWIYLYKSYFSGSYAQP